MIVRDNRSVPARGVANLRELASIRDLVAVFCGKFSTVAIEEVPVIHREKLIMLDPWAAADQIVDNGQNPNFVFRLSLRDGWAMTAILQELERRRLSRVGVMVPNTAWGRSSVKAAEDWLATHGEVSVVSVQWYNWGEMSLLGRYLEARHAGAEAIVLVANEGEAAVLVKEIAAIPSEQRMPILSHWGVTGGDFPAIVGRALDDVDFSVVQTVTLVGRTDERTHSVIERAKRLFALGGIGDIKSQVGFAHAYDLTHLLALAVDRAGSTDRSAVRDALEHLSPYQGLIKNYLLPFSPENHEALTPDLLFIGRFVADGIAPIGP